MDTKCEKILIKAGLESACFKAGKLFAKGEFVTRAKFEELFLISIKLENVACFNCTSLMYIEYDSKVYRYSVLTDISANSVYYFRCTFNVVYPGGKHEGSGPYTSIVGIEEWTSDKPVDYVPDIFDFER